MNVISSSPRLIFQFFLTCFSFPGILSGRCGFYPRTTYNQVSCNVGDLRVEAFFNRCTQVIRSAACFQTTGSPCRLAAFVFPVLADCPAKDWRAFQVCHFLMKKCKPPFSVYRGFHYKDKEQGFPIEALSLLFGSG